MNLEFVLAIGFGLGVAGFVGRLAFAPAATLASRVATREVTIEKLGVVGKAKELKQSAMAAFSSSGKSKREGAFFELPEILELLTVSLGSGDGIYRAFTTVVPRCEGELARELTKALTAVEYGGSLGKELESVAQSLPHPQIVEFVNKVSLSLERGSPLAKMLGEQAVSVRAEIRHRLLAQAGKNETKMLIPLVFLILPITVLFAIYPSLELLNFGFI